jgi:hypothetical protein
MMDLVAKTLSLLAFKNCVQRTLEEILTFISASTYNQAVSWFR